MGINTLSFDKSNDGETPEGIGFATFQLATKIMDKLIHAMAALFAVILGSAAAKLRRCMRRAAAASISQGIVVNDVGTEGPAAQ